MKRIFLALAFLLCVQLTSAQVVPATADGSWTALETSQFPSYATATVANASTYTWPDGVTCWYSGTSFTFTVKITDGQTHTVTFYLKDDDSQGRSETITGTGPVTNTQNISNFAGGTNITFQASGTSVFTVTRTAGPNAVVTTISFGSGVQVTHSVTLTWPAVSGATSYNLYRNGTKLVSVSAPPYKDTTVVAGATYTYAVTSVNGSGESAQTPVTSFLIPTP